MEHTAWYRDYLFVSELGNLLRARRKDRAPESQRAKIAFAKGIQKTLVSHDNIVLFTAFNLVDLIALKSQNDVIDRQYLLAFVLQIILMLRMEGCDYVFRLYDKICFTIFFLENKKFPAAPRYAYDLFALWLWNGHQTSFGVVTCQHDLAVLRVVWGNWDAVLCKTIAVYVLFLKAHSLLVTQL